MSTKQFYVDFSLEYAIMRLAHNSQSHKLM